MRISWYGLYMSGHIHGDRDMVYWVSHLSLGCMVEPPYRYPGVAVWVPTNLRYPRYPNALIPV